MKKLLLFFIIILLTSPCFAYKRGSGFNEGDLKMGNYSIDGDPTNGLNFDPDSDGTNEITFNANGSISSSSSSISGDSINLTLINTTAEDIEGGRESQIIFKGTQSGSEETTLVKIQGSHDGTSDDQKGDLIFYNNDGNDSDSPTETMRIDSTGLITIAKNLTVGSAGTDGKLTIYSEQGTTDYSVSLNPNSTMTSAANFYLPADEPAAESFLKMGTDGIIDYEIKGVDLVGTSPITINGGANVNDCMPGTDADITIAITDAAADGSTKGIATFNADDFDASSGVISIDNTNFTTDDVSEGSTNKYDHSFCVYRIDNAEESNSLLKSIDLRGKVIRYMAHLANDTSWDDSSTSPTAGNSREPEGWFSGTPDGVLGYHSDASEQFVTGMFYSDTGTSAPASTESWEANEGVLVDASETASSIWDTDTFIYVDSTTGYLYLHCGTLNGAADQMTITLIIDYYTAAAAS